MKSNLALSSWISQFARKTAYNGRLQLVARELQTFEINGLPEPWRVLRELLDDAALLTDEAAEELANRILDT